MFIFIVMEINNFNPIFVRVRQTALKLFLDENTYNRKSTQKARKKS